MRAEFKPFDYANLPDSGLYWIAGINRVWNIDVDDEGRTTGTPTDETEKFVSLVWLDVYAEHGLEGKTDFHLDPVDPANLGGYDESSVIQFIAPAAAPAHPLDLEEKQHSIEGVVFFLRSEGEGRANCVCCPEGQAHVFSHQVRWDTRSDGLESHFSKSPDDLVSKMTRQFANEGRRIRLTVELIDEDSAQPPAL